MNFLTEEVDSTLALYFDITQRTYPGCDTIGGEEFVFKKDIGRNLFKAEYTSLSSLGNSQASLQVTPTAQSIFEPASYEWVNQVGLVFDAGLTFSILLIKTRALLQARITAKTDGYRDTYGSLYYIIE